MYERPSKGVNERTSEVKMKEDNMNYEDKTERYPDTSRRYERRNLDLTREIGMNGR